ncbi:MAG: T9SS type A sorting domain-containing protein [Bacteroidales bacterium]|nr:T9SS type A sorting domain-containing protein [Bacteroidales bacterium]MCF8455385.1 T9SS type A sorting domain-containing protein [Bacteroidales bacterium]
MKSKFFHFILFVSFLFLTVTLSASAPFMPSSTGSQSTNLFSDVFLIQGISCPGANNAVAVVATFTGQPPYTFLWSTGDTTDLVNNLSAGFYTITVTEAQGAVDILELFVPPPDPILITITQIGADSLVAEASGGMPPYSYVWSNGFQAPQIGNLPNGLYEVTVTDANLCSQTENYEIAATGPGWVIYPNSQYHSIVIPSQADLTVNGDPLEPGDQIGVFYDSSGTLACGGILVWQGVSDTLLAYGDIFTTTSVVEGFYPGEQFTWKIWDASRDEVFKALVEYNPTAFPNAGNYSQSGESGIIKLQGYAEQFVGINEGWGIMSTYIDPFETDINAVLSSIYQNLIILKDENGEVVYPAWNLNTIGSLIIGEGYQIKMNTLGGTKTTFVLYINGIRVDPDTEIILHPGWNIISFLHKEPYPITTMLQSIDTVTGIVKDELGNPYIPDDSPWVPPLIPLNNIGDMQPGKGYKIKIIASNDVILMYPPPPTKKYEVPTNMPTPPEHFNGVINTGNNHTMIIPVNALPFDPEKGDEIAVLSNSQIVGAAQLHQDYFCVAVFGDDETIKEKDGPVDGNVLHFRYWDNSEQCEIEFRVCEWIEGDDVYEIDKISIAGETEFKNESDQVTISVYPNPNMGDFSLLFDGVEEISNLEITNTLGQVLYESSEIITSNQVLEFSDFIPGVYYAKVKFNETTILKKIIVQ